MNSDQTILLGSNLICGPYVCNIGCQSTLSDVQAEGNYSEWRDKGKCVKLYHKRALFRHSKQIMHKAINNKHDFTIE